MLTTYLLFLSFVFSPTRGSNAAIQVSHIHEIKRANSIEFPLSTGCPQQCDLIGSDPSKWTQLHSQSDLSGCNEPLLFALNIQNPPSEFATFQTCVTGRATNKRGDCKIIEERASQDLLQVSSNCGADTATIKALISTSSSKLLTTGNEAAAAAELLAYYVDTGASCGTTIIFAKSEDYFKQGFQMLQTCVSNNKRAQTIGLFAVSSIEGVPQAQSAMKAWSNGECLETTDQKPRINIDLGILSVNNVEGRAIELRSRFSESVPRLIPRAECRAIQVKSGDSCASLSKRCKITSTSFNKYNSKANFCSKLVPNQWVCCTSGTLPDKTPKPLKDGTCFTFSIKSGDSCYSIAQSYGISESTISAANINTWGWSGCSRLQIGQRICLSKGKSPMPMTISGAECGPQKPGTSKPPNLRTGWELAGLNPCPLKACCSGYGFCGTTGDFCTNTTGKGSAPGTYRAGTPGCIANCGTAVVGNSKKPVEFLRVGYFQGYNFDRPCLNMDVSKLTGVKSTYTHIHFAFSGLTNTLSLTMQPEVKTQFTKFVAMKGPWKKVISFGGWAESTDAATFQRYRNAIKPANQQKFASAVLAFVQKYKLDGVDFDWEYPGSTSSAGSTGPDTDASNYLQFLSLMRKKLGTGRYTMSVALPAAYWYLKPFPVEKMAPLVDYLVYMTYDLHGQWDYGNQFASPSCPSGNCLRSHVNKTETYNALSMITKAGVPASKIVVGISSYGRSFRMKDPKCTGPTCKFTGSFAKSEAEPGVCTRDAGYLANAEIQKIVSDAKAGKKGVTAKSWYDKASDSDIMVWGTQGKGSLHWVAYMNDDTKKKRTEWARALNFAGTVDWAIDLQTWYSPQPK
ncbi:hypothetical protein G7046_g1854 [Stylonectria norvegica]|nr:hypothetical protein G7046_g1854 [Stylonectria norvegica]